MSRNTTPPLLFLDIDDVLCLNERYGGYDVVDAVHLRHKSPTTVFQHVFSRQACNVLEQVHEALGGHIRYVISSSWREALHRHQLCEVFERTGLEFVAATLHDAWCTPTGICRGIRVDDVAAWLDGYHQGEPFVIVDDTFSGLSLKPALTNPAHPFAGRVVLCAEGVGLLPEHVAPLLAAMRRPLRP